MKIKKSFVGIVLAFSLSGLLATKMDANAYEKIYAAQDEKEQQIGELMTSEFLTSADQSALEQQLSLIAEAEQTETRKALKNKLIDEEQLISSVEKNLIVEEAKAAKAEYQELLTETKALVKKSQQGFVDENDKQQVIDLERKIVAIEEPQKVAPVRELVVEMAAVASELEDNHQVIVALVNELKTTTSQANDLAKKDYLLAADKETLKSIQTKNRAYFSDASNLAELEKLQSESLRQVEEIALNQSRSEKDFEENREKSQELSKAYTALLAEGNLTKTEKEELTKKRTSIEDLLKFKDYHPGDLATNYQQVKNTYEKHVKLSDQRNAEEKKRQEEAAAARLAAEKAAELQAQKEAEKAAELQAQQVQAEAAASREPVLVGDWYQAPAGYKFLKVESGLTYGQVKNPGNFQQITVEEAANYRPGHGNGSAKQ